MISTSNKIILVDDSEDDLNKLSEQLFNLKISCLPCKYDIAEPIDKPFENVRLAFFDINLGGYSSPETSALRNSIANALKNYISVDNGPYALFFWTTFRDQIEGIKEFINERYKNEIAHPFVVDCIDKNVVKEDKIALKEELNKKLINPILNALISYENHSVVASSNVINNICKGIPTNDKWGDTKDFSENFNMILSKIAAMTSGFVHAKSNPTKSIMEALTPLHNFYLKNINTDDSWKEILSKLNNAKNFDELEYPRNYKAGLLNTIFHIENIGNNDPSKRGAVIKLNLDGRKYINYFELSSKELFEKFIPFNRDKIDKTKRNEIRAQSQFVLIEISASCDYSQNKKRLNKYILGLKTPVIHSDLINKKKRAQCILELPSFLLNSEQFTVYINYNYVLGLNPSDNLLGDILFSFKDDIVTQIGNRYANYISRIGIISFN